MSEKPVVGFIGLGLMGHGMANNIRKAGYELWVTDRFARSAVDSLVASGAQEGATPRQLAEKCDVIHLSLPTSEIIEQVMRGEDGILAGARPGLVVVDASTADPQSTEALARELRAKEGVFVDAGLGGTPAHAETGQLIAMVGCEEDVLERLRPIFACWASSVKRIGPVGSGHKMKLLMNFIGLSYGALYSEVVVLGAKVGIPPQTVREVIASSRMNNGFFETFMAYVVDRNRDAHQFSIANAAKDIKYLNKMASDANVINVMAGATSHYYTHAVAIGKASEYVPMLSDHVGTLNGVDLAEEVLKGAI